MTLLRRMPWGRLAVGGGLLAAVIAGLMATHRAAGGPVVASVTLGEDPSAVAVDAPTGRAFVATYAFADQAPRGHVSMFDTHSGALLYTAAMGGAPFAVIVDGRTGRVFVANLPNTVSVLDARSGRVLRTVAVDAEPTGEVLDARAGRLFVPTVNGRVSILDAGTGDRVRAINVSAAAGAPAALALDARQGHLVAGHLLAVSPAFASGRTTFSVLAASSGRVLHTVAGAQSWFPAAIAVDDTRGRAFVPDFRGNGVSVFDTGSGALLHTTALSGSHAAVAVDDRTGHVFISSDSTSEGSVTMLDAMTGRVLRTAPVGPNPGPIVVDTRHDRVFVTGWGPMVNLGQYAGSGSISVLDARSGRVLRTLRINAAVLAVDEQTGHVIAGTYGPIKVSAPDAWGWLPGSLRRYLPFLMSPHSRTIPAGVTTLDPLG